MVTTFRFCKYRISGMYRLKMQPHTHEHYEQSPPDKIKKISDYLWEHKNIIDKYLEKIKITCRTSEYYF